jgi:hypothetical protein
MKKYLPLFRQCIEIGIASGKRKSSVGHQLNDLPELGNSKFGEATIIFFYS